MASLYGFYIKEREDYEILETDFGFASYKISGTQVYLRDIYIVPKFRNTYYATSLADQICKIAKEKGCKELIGSVSTVAKNSSQSMKAVLAYGMNFCMISPDGQMMYFKKEL